jgi:hypothetical protein
MPLHSPSSHRIQRLAILSMPHALDDPRLCFSAFRLIWLLQPKS